MSLSHARIFCAQRRLASWSCNLPTPREAGSSVQRPAWLCSGKAAFRALRPQVGWPGERIQMGRRGVSAAPLRGPRQELDELEEAPRGPPPGSRGPGLGVLRGRPSPALRLTPLPAGPTPSRLTPRRALSTRRAAAPPRSRRLLPAPSPLAPLPRRRRQERAGSEGVKPGLFPARRDPELSQARC